MTEGHAGNNHSETDLKYLPENKLGNYANWLVIYTCSNVNCVWLCIFQDSWVAQLYEKFRNERRRLTENPEVKAQKLKRPAAGAGGTTLTTLPKKGQKRRFKLGTTFSRR